MVTRGYTYVMSISAIAITGCKKSYTPPVVASNNNCLVVEGVITAADGGAYQSDFAEVKITPPIDASILEVI
ncbi:MAG: hypothetical protein JWQ66_2527 [Mucilaginibacter sp.]|nr:hypothetical protein [Mucilaginibacter sp.]